jgi:hypothetical protein
MGWGCNERERKRERERESREDGMGGVNRV